MSTKAFAYIRVSGPDQLKGDGPERQRLAIAAFARANDIEIVEYFTEQVSGKADSDERDEWTRLLNKLNGVRTIVVEKLDRLARALIIQERILLDLVARDVTLKTADGQDTSEDDPTRVLFRQLLGAIAQFERACIVAKLRSARGRVKAATGRCEGVKPYGVDLAEQNTLAMMQAWRDEGRTYDSIAGSLNAARIPTRYGREWYGCTVSNILKRSGLD